MSNKKSANELAYEAGWNAYMTEPGDRKSPDACPFGVEHGTQREQWLKGFEEALESTPDDSELRKRLKEARA